MNIAAVRIRSGHDMSRPQRNTLQLLRLLNTNSCVILPDTQTNKGMLNKVKDYVTWGTIDDETIEEIYKKRGEEYKGRKEDCTEHNKKKYKKYFRLSPPKGGFERKGIKTPFTMGGALGNRKNITGLIKRMI
ncbi:MAG: uL30 family ribosomal protein [Candidatus Woesearchaeota archaeon]